MINIWKETDSLKHLHEIKENDLVIGSAICQKYGSGELKTNDKEYFLNHHDKTGFVITDGKEQIGYITQKFVKTGKFLWFDSGYSYFEIKVYDDKFDVFDIGLGKNKHYYQFNKDGKTLGMIHKPDVVKNRMDEYRFLSKEKNMFLIMYLYTLFLETTAFYNFMGTGEGNVTTQKSYMSTKQIRLKFDNDFLNQFKDEINNI